MFSSIATSTAVLLGTLLFLWYIRNRRRIKANSDEAHRLLQNKVVLITGASSGLGEQLAKIFHCHGCKVILASRRIEELERVKKNLIQIQNASSNEPQIVYLDLAQPELIEEIVESRILPLFDSVDILINNAGLSCRCLALETGLEVDRRMLNVNFLGPATLTKAILRHNLEHHQPCQVVAVSSVQGRFAIPNRSSYSSSKHALQAFFDSLRAEVAGSKLPISISVISPGYIRTNLSVNALKNDGSNYGVMDATTAKGYEPGYVATRIVEMVVNRDSELILSTLIPKLLTIVRATIPGLYFYIMAVYAKKPKK